MRKFVVGVLLVLVGAVGFGVSSASAEPLPDTKQIATGGFHTCALLTNGRVNCWGANFSGELGDGTTTSSTTPVAVQAAGGGGELARVKQLAAGGGHTCALLTNGRVNCWGANFDGQLGDGTTTARTTPVAVQAVGGGGELTGVKRLSAGLSHMCALLANGRVNCWGNNLHGQLGDGTIRTTSATPVAVQAVGGGGELTRVKQLAAGGFHTCALLNSGRVNCWGDNFDGQLGDGTTADRATPVVVQGVGGGGELTRVKQLATGGGHTCALLNTGRVNCWGTNSFGQLGDGTISASTTPVVVQGVGGGGELTNVKQLAAGGSHTCAQLTNRRVNCWGNNIFGRLGDGTTTSSTTPVAVQAAGGGGELTRVQQLAAGDIHTCARLNSGRVNCWGNNDAGQLGDGTTTTSATPVVVPVELNGVKQLAAGNSHTCALLNSGRVNCWGENFNGDLGDGTTTDSTTPVVVQAVGGGGELTRVKQLAAGNSHTCALLNSGRVNCWGYNLFGQLGDGTTTNSTTPVAVQGVGGGGELTRVKQLAAGDVHTCALLTNGQVNCWGLNNFGQLGDGTTTDSATPVEVPTVGGGGEPNRVEQLVAGNSHTCARLASGRVNCWGDNFYGQLGDGTTTKSATPVAVQAVGGGGELAKVRQLAASVFHTCARLASGRVNCWGDNSFGQLGDGTILSPPDSGRTTPVAVQAVGGGGELTRVKQLAAGVEHTCALLTSGRVNCWGFNTSGQLGLGTFTSPRPTPVAVQAVGGGGELTKVRQIAAGFSHTCALLNSGRVDCWGDNSSGQLGDGTTTHRATPVAVITTL